MVIDNQSVSTDDADADCTVGVSLEDLQAIVAGDLDPTAAFMQGKLKVDGDMGVAMKLSQIF
jgi:putative sterol carrier protein